MSLGVGRTQVTAHRGVNFYTEQNNKIAERVCEFRKVFVLKTEKGSWVQGGATAETPDRCEIKGVVDRVES